MAVEIRRVQGMKRCDMCGSRIDDAVEPGERLVGELICQRCMSECSDVVCEIENGARKARSTE
jgi:hypothetical protein